MTRDRSASSPTRRCASAARRARSRASSGTSCPTTASHSPACRTTTPCALGASTWRHVAFIERRRTAGRGRIAWLMMSDVCKHCERAGCLEACPTGAIIRTEFDTIYVQPDICNGCGYCVPACPFGVIERREDDGRAWKCTLCYDRLQGDLEPACAKACPTDSILFGPLERLRAKAAARVDELHARGVDARLYGESDAAQPGHRRPARVLPARRRAGGVQPAAAIRSCRRKASVRRGSPRRRARSRSARSRSAP